MTSINKFPAFMIAGLIIFAACNGTGSSKETGSKTPNIVFILADDLGYGDLSCYGQDTLHTPHIDEMAGKGIKFTNFYTGSTVCAPSRASLLTGMHTGHVSVRGNQPDQLLKDEDVTVAEILKDAGYVTGAVGKWGVGHPPPPDDPQRNGFDYFYGYLNMWHAHNFYPEFLYKNGEKVELPGNELVMKNGENPWADKPEGTGVAAQKETYVHPLFDEEAMQFLERNQDTSFFLYMAYNVPHANNEAGGLTGNGMEVDDYGKYAEKPWPDTEKGFAKMITNLDNSVGMINQKLQELGIDENTLVIFCSDNGPHQEGGHTMEYFNSNGSKRGMKRDLYDGGVLTPFIAKWPGKIKPGTSSDHLSAFWDFLPTVAEIAGVDVPENTDGISFLPALLGNEEEQKKHDYLYWEFYEQGGKQAIVKDQWKAVRLDVRTTNSQPTALFNLKNDPEENNDVAGQNPELVSELEDLMMEAHEPMEIMSLFKEEVSADTEF